MNKSQSFLKYFCVLVFSILFFENTVIAQEVKKEVSVNNDWPMFRCDAKRSGFSKSILPDKLKLIWIRNFSALTPIWPDEVNAQFDSNYHPIVMGQNIFIASPKNDCLYSISTVTGEIQWKFYADGPIRFAPAGQGDKLYCVSDDSYLYCLQAATGKLLWKFRGAPNDSKILGNGRLISPWPARGGPAVFEGTVYFSAGIWPFMGTFIYALNAETGKLLWANTGSGALYGTQAHDSPAFAGSAPQGYITVTKDKLLIPNGKASPTIYDAKTGELLYSNFARGGGYFVAASENFYFLGGAAFFIKDNKHAGNLPAPQILTPDFLYAGSLQVFDINNILVQEPKKPEDKSPPILPLNQLWKAKLKMEAQILVGTRLYASKGNSIIAYDLPEFDKELKEPKLAWQLDVGCAIVELIAADNKLFGVTLDGKLLCFGDDKTEKINSIENKEIIKPFVDDVVQIKAPSILTDIREGYVIVLGVGTGELTRFFLQQSKLQIIVIEADILLVNKFRQKWDESHLYGSRIVIHHGNPFEFSFPPYIANLIVCENVDFSKENLSLLAPKIFQTLRPYGGVACLKMATNLKEKWQQALSENKLSHAVNKSDSEWEILTREGPLDGAGTWNHQYGDSANTVISNDTIVKLPLGVLWFGGPSNKNNFAKHGHGPNPQVVGGRVITQGTNSIQAYDVYTGRLFWELELPNIGKDFANMEHQPGSSAIGSNYVSLADFIYVVYEGKCLKVDANTGKKIDTYELPPLEGQATAPKWGFIANKGEFLIASAEPLSDKKINPGGYTWNGTTSKAIVVLNRLTGKVIWKKEAEYGFRHNTIAISNDTIYCIDKIPKDIQIVLMPTKTEGPGKICAFNLQTGDLKWSTDQGVFGTWLSYSAEFDIVVQAGRASRDMLKDEINNRMSALQGKDGKLLWDKPNSYSGPCMILGKDILAQGNGFSLLEGTPKMIKDPITNKDVAWEFSRSYGCNTAIGSKNLLTFRSAAAGYFNLENNSGTGNFGGFKTSCTSTLVIADGLLNVPDYTRGCTCSYQNRATLALIHQPDIDIWTFNKSKWKGQPVQRLGINLGAPGDRISETKTLWIEYPAIGGPSQEIPIKILPKETKWFNQNSFFTQGKELSWVAASGAKGLESIIIPTGGVANKEVLYTIRLIFSEPDEIKLNERLIDIYIQKNIVVEGLDIFKEATGKNKVLIKEFKNIKLNQELNIELKANTKATNKETILCGVEMIAE